MQIEIKRFGKYGIEPIGKCPLKAKYGEMVCVTSNGKKGCVVDRIYKLEGSEYIDCGENETRDMGFAG